MSIDPVTCTTVTGLHKAHRAALHTLALEAGTGRLSGSVCSKAEANETSDRMVSPQTSGTSKRRRPAQSAGEGSPWAHPLGPTLGPSSAPRPLPPPPSACPGFWRLWGPNAGLPASTPWFSSNFGIRAAPHSPLHTGSTSAHAFLLPLCSPPISLPLITACVPLLSPPPSQKPAPATYPCQLAVHPRPRLTLRGSAHLPARVSPCSLTLPPFLSIVPPSHPTPQALLSTTEERSQEGTR